MTYDLILRGGRVIDPSNGSDAVSDVASRAARSHRWPLSCRASAGTNGARRVGIDRDAWAHRTCTPMSTGAAPSLGIDAEEFCRTSA
jgi:dihydroorotase